MLVEPLQGGFPVTYKPRNKRLSSQKVRPNIPTSPPKMASETTMPTAMVCDKHGRMWAGTLSHGVSVYTGSEWWTYNAPDEPLGCHVFALGAAPGDE